MSFLPALLPQLHFGPHLLPVMPLMFLQAVLSIDGSPLPGWLTDQRFLNPLLAAYDSRVAILDAELRERAGRVEAMQKQVGDSGGGHADAALRCPRISPSPVLEGCMCWPCWS